VEHRSNQFKGLNTDDVREGEYIGTDRMTGSRNSIGIKIKTQEKTYYCWIYCIFQIDKRIRKVFVYDDQEMKDHGRKWSKNFNDIGADAKDWKRKPFKIIVG
jgi:recombinational DNA repair protein RecT